MSPQTASTAATVARLVGVPGITTALVIFLCAPAPEAAAVVRDGEIGRIGLLEKDAKWNVVTAANGGASGGVWYTRRGPALRFTVRAGGLRPAVHYLIELNVDGVTYEVSSHAADPRGAVAFDTTLAEFANGVCDKGPYTPPAPLRGTHHIKFLVKRDGHPVSGSLRQASSGNRTPPTLACQGNGDEDFSYALFEDNVAEYTGTR